MKSIAKASLSAGALLLLVSCAADGQQHESEQQEYLDLSQVNEAIKNGTPSSVEWAVKVNTIDDDGVHWTCSGTLLRNDVVLTARHCVQWLEPSQITVRSEAGEAIKARTVVEHPDVNGLAMDVALIRLMSSFTVDGSKVSHYKLLYRTDSEALRDTAVTCIGYGISECNAGGGTSGVQREGTSIVTSVGAWRDIEVTEDVSAQVPGAGDSGGSCYTPTGRVTHVNRTASCQDDGGGSNDSSQGVRGEAMGPWVDRTIAQWTTFLVDGGGILPIPAL